MVYFNLLSQYKFLFKLQKTDAFYEHSVFLLEKLDYEFELKK